MNETHGISLQVLRNHLKNLLDDSSLRSTDSAVASALLDISECIVLVLDLDHRVVFANPYCEELMGYTLDELEGVDWVEEFVSGDVQAEVEHLFHRAAEGFSTRGYVNAVHARSGPRMIKWYDRIISDEAGKTVGVLAIGHDVTTERAALDQLRTLNNQLESLVEERTRSLEDANRVLEATLDTSVVCLAYLDTEFNFVRVNRAYAAAVDREPDFFVGKNHFDLYPNEENQKIFERVRDSGRPFSVEAKPFEYEHEPDRGLTHWDWTLVPIFDGDDRVSGLVFTLQDVTQRVKMLEEARVREAELTLRETAIASSINGIAFADTEGFITYVNASCLNLWTLDDERDVVGRHMTEFWASPADASQVLARLREGGAWFGRLVAKLPDGRRRTMQVSANVVMEDGRPVALMGSFVDVTMEAEAEEFRARQLAEKEVLLREIHHRVKNSLQVVSSLLYLQSARTDNEETQALFDRSRDRLVAMSLVHETLYQSGDLNSVHFEAYLTRLVRAIAASHSTLARGVTLEVDVDLLDMTIERAIPCGLIVNEWVTNALKHAFDDHGGRVLVRATAESNGPVRLEVTDDGAGFPATDERLGGQLGFKLGDALAQQLEGELNVSSAPGATKLSVVFMP